MPLSSTERFSKAVHRSERGLPNSPTKKKEIIQHLALKHGIIPNSVEQTTLDSVVQTTPNSVAQTTSNSAAQTTPNSVVKIKSNPVVQAKSNSISDLTKNNVIQFYELNEISNVAPGKKDVMVIQSYDGSKVKVQKRHLVMTVREVYEQFKISYPNEKIGSTSFSLLRPKHILPICDIPQNVCLCKYHANVDLLLSSLNPILNTPRTTSLFREALVCNSEDEECMSSKCNNCGNLKNFDKLFECDDETRKKDLTYFQWKTNDSKILKMEQFGTVQNAINELKNQTYNFLIHSFITHVQYAHFEECKNNATRSSIVLQIDFSENYRTAYQNEIQNAFFNYNQVSLFNAVVWPGRNSEVLNYTLVSDDVSHDKYSIHVCLSEIFTDLKKRFSSLKTVNIFSDGASSQFKQRYSFANLTFLSNDYNIDLTLVLPAWVIFDPYSKI
ncbi:unnamed protein product [Rotaria sp. Silwood2]|nr:unnamed protein product [Rotaria sp. Silwood2]